MTALDVLDRLTAIGCQVRVEGQKLKVRGPDLPEVAGLVSELHAQREEAIAMLDDVEGKAPPLNEVKAALPPGVRLLSYRPKESPFAAAPVSVVTNVRRFVHAHLRDMAWRLEHPNTHACAPLNEILAKLAEAGLELAVDLPPSSTSPTAQSERLPEPTVEGGVPAPVRGETYWEYERRLNLWTCEALNDREVRSRFTLARISHQVSRVPVRSHEE
jgi:hypothetical protein